MIRAYVDSNVILRFLIGDPPEMAEESARLFRAVEDRTVTLIVDDVVVAEVVWVLSSYYRHTPRDIAAVLRGFLLQDGIEVQERDTLLLALTLYETKNVDFADALLAARMQERGIRAVFSFDRHFDRLAGVRRIPPAEVTTFAGT
jgi:predicted nucleic acid-binding protein